MQNYRYDSAYNSVLKRKQYIEEIRLDFDKHDSKISREKYNNSLFCPFCRKMPLVIKYGKVKPFHLSDHKKMNHSDNCDMLVPFIEVGHIEEFIKNNIDNSKLGNKLKELLDKMDNDENSNNQVIEHFVRINKQFEITNSNRPIKKETCKDFYQVPVKSLNRTLFPSDYQTFKFFYGSFTVISYKPTFDDENKLERVLLILNNNKNTISLWLNGYAVKFKEDIYFKSMSKVKISLVGKIIQNGKYNNISISDSRRYLIELINNI